MSSSEGEGNQSFEVETILDSRKRGRTTEFLVRWKGYDEEEDTWEPLKNIAAATTAMNTYYKEEAALATKTASRRTVRGAGDTLVSEKVETSSRKKGTTTRTITTLTKTETSSLKGAVSESSSPEASPTVTRRSLRSQQKVVQVMHGDGSRVATKRSMLPKFAWLSGPCKMCSWFKPTRQDIPIIILVSCLLVIASTFYIAKN